MADIIIEIRDNGPLLVKGGAALTDASGNSYETKETLFLCRCGQSDNKPFCDGTHKRRGFESTPRA